MVPSRTGAAWGLAKAIDDGKSVGVLVDQKFSRGVDTTFFGQPCLTNPLLPKLVRQFNLPVYPARCIRIGGGRFKLILEDEVKFPKNENGEIDIQASAQLLNDIVEGWVRQNPDQWMWLHKRWDTTKHMSTLDHIKKQKANHAAAQKAQRQSDAAKSDASSEDQ